MGQITSAPRDAVSEDTTLNELLIKIRTDLEIGLGRTGKAWRGLMTHDAIRQHEVLLSLRHWEDDIRNDAGVLSALEPDADLAVSAPFKVLAARVRSFLSEIHENVEQIREVCGGDGDDTTGFDDAVESLIEELEHTVECLRTQVEPLQMVFEAIMKGGAAMATATPAHAIARMPKKKEAMFQISSEPVSGGQSEPIPIPPGPSKATSKATDPGITHPDRGRGGPTANPPDRNPPSDTLRVSNLPIDVDEEDLKSLFSKEKGYKRLYFRAPRIELQCIVEFEDVSSATRALSNLHGHKLHNSTRGGIRLSFFGGPRMRASFPIPFASPGPSTSATTRALEDPVLKRSHRAVIAGNKAVKRKAGGRDVSESALGARTSSPEDRTSTVSALHATYDSEASEESEESEFSY